jgi:hypothetical protein
VYACPALIPNGVCGSATTAADGSYSIAGLAPGTYIVGFYPDDGQTGSTATGGSSDVRGYIDQSYNNKPTGSLATTVVVTAGATKTGINAALADAG